jgi:acetoin utilization deacetylase AcuC-like enzyme
MIIVFDEQKTHYSHKPKFELYDGQRSAYPEVPERIENIEKALRSLRDLSWIHEESYSDEVLFSLHEMPYLNYQQTMAEALSGHASVIPSNFIHDTYAPLTSGTYAAARRSLELSLMAAELVAGGQELVYALCRPPGHHAGGNYMGGYCYFNNAALAAQYLSQSGRVAVLDIDFHHGNGTQDLFYERDDVLYVSIHADPVDNYPYTRGFATETGRGPGVGANRNIVIAKNCGPENYMAALVLALESVRQFQPDFLVVSLGFDGYKDDPIAGFGLSARDFREIASQIGELAYPTMLVQEGGYCVEALGELAKSFCLGLMSARQNL